MSLKTHRLKESHEEPFTLEIDGWPPPSTVLWHLTGELPGLRVIAKKSWALTDDYEAYFTYRDRLFVLYSPMALIWISLIGQPPDEAVFAEVEAAVKRFSRWKYFLVVITFFRYLFLPLNPPKGLVESHESGAANQRHAV